MAKRNINDDALVLRNGLLLMDDPMGENIYITHSRLMFNSRIRAVFAAHTMTFGNDNGEFYIDIDENPLNGQILWNISGIRIHSNDRIEAPEMYAREFIPDYEYI